MQLNKHETPAAVATLLARHIPRGDIRVLDPAVGNGALLTPIVRRLGKASTVVCVDIDAKALLTARVCLSASVPHISYIKGDFLRIVNKSPHLKAESFDCIVMNPPFLARRNGDWPEVITDAGSGSAQKVPIELAFVWRCLDLLRPRGTLLAILPASFVSSEAFVGFRKRLAARGRFRYVHELPKFTFRGVEGRVYLVVFEKGSSSDTVELRNHDLKRPHKLRFEVNLLGTSYRLDYAYQQFRLLYQQLVARSPTWNWQTLDSLFSIERGLISAPHSVRGCLHTSNFDGDFWQASKISSGRIREAQSKENTVDWFMSRVGRSCACSLAPVRGPSPRIWSDCVFRVRWTGIADGTRALLALRALLTSVPLISILERGVGATYITRADLQSLAVPTAGDLIDPAQLSRYRVAVNRGCAREMRSIEDAVRSKLFESEACLDGGRAL